MTLTVDTGRRQKVAAAAYRMRHHALNMGEAQGQGYVGQALGAADMLASVYADQLRYRPNDPKWEERDRFLLSTGHYAIGLYAALAEAGIVFAPPGELGWGERVRRLIGPSPQADWTVERIAAAFATSASTLRRRLAQEGETVGQCLRDVRLETGLVLLQSSTLQVSEVAARCGYGSHSRFSAAFRERFGFAPSHLRP